MARCARLSGWLLLLAAVAIGAPSARGAGAQPEEPSGELEGSGLDEGVWQDSEQQGDARPDVWDPWQGFNRGIFSFNEFVMRNGIEPFGRAWAFVMPTLVRKSIRNVYRNARTPIVLVNHLLQGRPRRVGVDFGRFVLNTTLGVAGIMDPAVEAGLFHEDADFGQTFGIWGIPAGPYLVVPVIGPSSPRDAAGLALDTAAFAVGYFVPFWASASISAVDFANRYSFLVDDIAREREEAFDWYAAVRNAYVSNRWEKVHGPVRSADEGEDEDDLYYYEDDEGEDGLQPGEEEAVEEGDLHELEEGIE